MLVLSRKVGEKIVVDDKVTITINRISGGRVSVGIEAPPGVRVVRSELARLPRPAQAAPPVVLVPGLTTCEAVPSSTAER